MDVLALTCRASKNWLLAVGVLVVVGTPGWASAGVGAESQCAGDLRSRHL